MKITNERGTKTVFTYAHVKWFYGQSERAYYLNYFIKYFFKILCLTLSEFLIFSECFLKLFLSEEFKKTKKC